MATASNILRLSLCLLLVMLVSSCEYGPNDLKESPVSDTLMAKIANGDWITIQQRESGDVDFYRPWKDYVIGFGNKSDSFWLGLEKIHYICNEETSCYLKIKLEYNGTEYFANYTNFYLHNATDKYRLKVSGYEGKIWDSFARRHNNKQFSTFDQDNDSSPKNCAKARKGGYWYANCNESNLNGMWGVNRWHGIIWDALNYKKSLSEVQMVVQRKQRRD